jgi:hypothetical protein
MMFPEARCGGDARSVRAIFQNETRGVNVKRARVAKAALQHDSPAFDGQANVGYPFAIADRNGAFANRLGATDR